jgi:hypothetical protein
MRTNTELTFDSGNERARLISLEYVVITRSTYLKKGVVWKMSEWINLAESSGDYIVLADTEPTIYPPLPPSPEPEPEPEPESVAYRPRTSLYWTVDKDNYSIAVVTKHGVFQVKRCDNSVALTKRVFFPSVAAWTQTLQEGGNLVVSPPKNRKIICIPLRHYGYCKYM